MDLELAKFDHVSLYFSRSSHGKRSSGFSLFFFFLSLPRPFSIPLPGETQNEVVVINEFGRRGALHTHGGGDGCVVILISAFLLFNGSLVRNSMGLPLEI